MSIHADAVRVLTSWNPPNDGQRKLQATYLRHLTGHPDGVFRECHPDHLTASCLVVSADRQQVMLNLHRRYQIWVQFGGHCDPHDPSLAAAALREAVEESGIRDLRLVSGAPVQLSTHQVDCGPVQPSHHLDVRYVAVAPEGATPVVSDESLEVRWFGRSAAPISIDRPLRELIGLARWI